MGASTKKGEGENWGVMKQKETALIDDSISADWIWVLVFPLMNRNNGLTVFLWGSLVFV